LPTSTRPPRPAGCARARARVGAQHDAAERVDEEELDEVVEREAEEAVDVAAHEPPHDASELVAFIRERGPFCVGAACYPEVHPEAGDAASDLQHLKTKVDAGVDFLISQLFFDNASFHAFERRAVEAGITVPIIPGIMPVTNFEQIRRFTQMCGASLPAPLQRRLEGIADDPQEVFWAGVSYAAQQCRALLQPPAPDPFTLPRPGVPGIHFYTLNRSPSTRAIFEILQLSRACYG
jgi:methylenetetrahydrofolate reductase (NADPH)